MNTISNIIFFVLTAIIIIRFISSYIQNSKLEGVTLPNTTLQQITTSSAQLITLNKQLKPPLILLFWSINCPPCIVEMNRYTSAVKSNEIPPNKLVAINIGDSPKALLKYLKQHTLPMPLYRDPNNQLAALFKLNATPLVVHINKQGHASWISTGISPLGIIKAKELLSK